MLDTASSVLLPHQFLKMHQEMLAVVIDQHSIMAQFELDSDYARVLQDLHESLDVRAHPLSRSLTLTLTTRLKAFTLSLMNLIPTEQSTVKEGSAKLESLMSAAITKYHQTCTPGDYPDNTPTCSDAQ